MIIRPKHCLTDKWSRRTGFTIVELLIVIVVIGILVSTSLVAYNGIQNRSYLATAKSDLNTLSKKMALFKVSSDQDRYPMAISGSLRTGLEAVDMKLSTGSYSTVSNSNFTYYVNETGSDYVAMARVKNGPILYIKGSDPVIRENTTSTYPSGFPENHATAAGLSYSTIDYYPAYVGSGGGWRIWN